MDHLIQFIGRLHPLLVHLPVGIMALTLSLHALTWQGRCTRFRELLPLLWFVSCASAVLACVAGYCLSLSGGYGAGAIAVHMWLGIGLVLFSGVMYGMLQKGVAARLELAGILLVGLLLTATGHYGGNLTHGEDYLTEPLFALLGIKDSAAVRKPITDIREARVYQDLIVPVLDQKCYKCHNGSKQKGDLRLDSPEALLEGGEHGEVIVAGNAAESSLYARLVLPEDHDEHMPPEGKPQLTENEVKLIRWWLEEGNASFSGKVADIEQDEEIKTLLAGFVGPKGEKEIPSEIPTAKVEKADPKPLKKLKKMGVSFSPLTAGHTYLAANMVNYAHFGDNQLNELLKLKEQLVWLDLSDTKITDKGLAKIAEFKYLTRLNLDNTAITDAGLHHLKKLASLQYLNLYGTKVSDKGLQALAACKRLRKLYLWQTRVTPEGAKALQAKLNGNVTINAGSNFKKQ